MQPTIQSKLPNVGTTIFTVMSTLAVQYNAINLGQGFPDYEMSSELTNLVNEAMQKGNNQYVHMNGLPLLRQRLAEKVQDLYKCRNRYYHYTWWYVCIVYCLNNHYTTWR